MGIRDVILPGDMKELLNKVTEAKNAAEANLIARREETAAMRSQANTAKLLEDNPTLMRLRELEVLERVAASVCSVRSTLNLNDARSCAGVILDTVAVAVLLQSGPPPKNALGELLGYHHEQTATQ